MRSPTRHLALVTFLMFGSASAWAEEGRIPIFETTTITESGQYVLTRDITGLGVGYTIEISGTGSESIELDLNGFTITSGPTLGCISATNTRSLVIRNGFLKTIGSFVSIVIDSVGTDSNAVLEDLVISGGSTAIQLSPVHNILVRDNFLVDVFRGIYMFDTVTPVRGIIEGNVMREVNSQAVYAFDPTDGLQIRRNSISTTSDSGVVLAFDGTGLVIEDNFLLNESSNPLSYDIRLDRCSSCSVRNNHIRGINQTGGDGIWLNSVEDSQFTDNVVSDHGEHGIHLQSSHRNVFARNTTNNNGKSGINLSSSHQNTIEGNTSHGNGHFGLHINTTSDSNRVGRNSAVGNAGATSCSVPGPGTCGVPDYCNESASTTSFGDNLTPGPPPC